MKAVALALVVASMACSFALPSPYTAKPPACERTATARAVIDSVLATAGIGVFAVGAATSSAWGSGPVGIVVVPLLIGGGIAAIAAIRGWKHVAVCVDVEGS